MVKHAEEFPPVKSIKPKKIPEWWRAFILEYQRNGNVGVKAYQIARPESSYGCARVQVTRLLASPNFQAFYKELCGSKREQDDFTIQEYYKNLKDVARFRLADVFETDEFTKQPRLKEKWIEKLKENDSLESIKIQTLTLESGHVVQNIQLKPIERLKALEKLGKLLGYDTTADKLDVTSGGKSIEDNILGVVKKIREMYEGGKITPTDAKAIDVDSLSTIELED